MIDEPSLSTCQPSFRSVLQMEQESGILTIDKSGRPWYLLLPFLFAPPRPELPPSRVLDPGDGAEVRDEHMTASLRLWKPHIFRCRCDLIPDHIDPLSGRRFRLDDLLDLLCLCVQYVLSLGDGHSLADIVSSILPRQEQADLLRRMGGSYSS